MENLVDVGLPVLIAIAAMIVLFIGFTLGAVWEACRSGGTVDQQRANKWLHVALDDALGGRRPVPDVLHGDRGSSVTVVDAREQRRMAEYVGNPYGEQS